MNPPTLFDGLPRPRLGGLAGDLVREIEENGPLPPFPQTRRTDPVTSHLAAATVKPGNGALIEAIRSAARKGAPATAFVIAMRVEHVHPNRWSEASIRTAISRAGLRAVDTDGRSPRNQRCIRYSL